VEGLVRSSLYGLAANRGTRELRGIRRVCACQQIGRVEWLLVEAAVVSLGLGYVHRAVVQLKSKHHDPIPAWNLSEVNVLGGFITITTLPESHPRILAAVDAVPYLSEIMFRRSFLACSSDSGAIWPGRCYCIHALSYGVHPRPGSCDYHSPYLSGNSQYVLHDYLRSSLVSVAYIDRMVSTVMVTANPVRPASSTVVLHYYYCSRAAGESDLRRGLHRVTVAF
jgi:hypothetical protein